MKINKLRQIATKNGDEGFSRNYSNRLLQKDDILFEALGTIDELSSYLGLIYHYTDLEDIIIIQKNLQNINSQIATNQESKNYSKISFITLNNVDWLENQMQNRLDTASIESKLYLPGSDKTLNGAYYDYARAIARRAERRVIDFKKLHIRNDLNIVLKYLNRLSDYLFILSFNEK